MRQLKQISVIGLGLLGGSIALAVLRFLPNVRLVGYSHRSVTRRKARRLACCTEVVDDLAGSVSGSDLVILASPISAFEQIFSSISPFLWPWLCRYRRGLDQGFTPPLGETLAA